ncbi:hypothetical protein J31TS3_43180 [Paenibacillus lactis]|nr:hypothetical protein J31TS3_43180 [Paenibacillus lactis]
MAASRYQGIWVTAATWSYKDFLAAYTASALPPVELASTTAWDGSEDFTGSAACTVPCKQLIDVMEATAASIPRRKARLEHIDRMILNVFFTPFLDCYY